MVALTVDPREYCKEHNPNAPNKEIREPIKALMTTRGYTLADPDKPNRLRAWFVGGDLEPACPSQDMKAWKRVFDNLGRRELQEQARVIAAWVALGAQPAQHIDDGGRLVYKLKRAFDGTYMDVLYMDEIVRVMKGNQGAVYVFARVPADSN